MKEMPLDGDTDELPGPGIDAEPGVLPVDPLENGEDSGLCSKPPLLPMYHISLGRGPGKHSFMYNRFNKMLLVKALVLGTI